MRIFLVASFTFVAMPALADDGGALLPIGAACTDDAECTAFNQPDSGPTLPGHCVDGVCCATVCTDQCAACDVPGHLGECVPVTGAPHASRPPCASGADAVCGAVCDGQRTDMCRFPTNQPCGPLQCESVAPITPGAKADPNRPNAVGEATCDGNGHCAQQSTGVTQWCPPYACDPATSTCKSACSTNADCGSGAVCHGGACVFWCDTDAECGSGYLCYRNKCTWSCAVPNQCSFGSAYASAGCAVRPARSGRGWLAVTLAALAALVVARRARSRRGRS